MTSVGMSPALVVRDATDADNAALVALTAACTMRGDIALRMDRAPDFFALTRLEADETRVGIVAGEDGQVVGCVAASRRRAYVNGSLETICYVSDLKVHPSARGSGVADLLTAYARDASGELAGMDAPCVLTILGGNTPMERRARGPRGMPALSRFATLSVVAIPLLWERRERPLGLTVRSATVDDLDDMAALWNGRARVRQLAGVFDAGQLALWIADAPGLTLPDYLLAVDGSGRVVGFVGVWDQTAFKQLRVVSYSPRLALVRRGINLIAPLTGAPRLPEPGGALPALATVNLCAGDPAVLRALILEAYRRHRGGRFGFITVGLDVCDPLLDATRGLFGQPTTVHAYVSSARGIGDPQRLRGLPLHYETALV